MDGRSQSGTNALLGLAAAGTGAFLLARSLIRQHRWLDLAGRTVLVTGGSRGFGLLMAREFAGQGAKVVICARDEVELERSRQDLVAHGAEATAVVCDVTEREQVGRVIGDVEARFGGVDVLVNNAGTISVGPMEVMTVADYEEAMKVHFWGPLYAALAALPGMKRRGAGRIVNISSIGGKLAFPHLLPYTASKLALVGFSEGLRAELKKDNIYVRSFLTASSQRAAAKNNQLARG